MVILHTYIRSHGYIIADLPFRYNNGDDMPVEAREMVLDVEEDATYDGIKQLVVKQLDEEKQYGQDDTDGESERSIEITIP